jgi:hypothetical protein
MKAMNRFAAFSVPSIRDTIFVVVLVGTLLIGPRMLNGDLGRHLTLGKYMVSTLSIPAHDLFSFTRLGQPRPPYEWLAQVAFYLVYPLLGLDGVVLLTAFILALTFLFVYTDALHRSNLPILAGLLTLWAAAASSLDWLTRPHIFSFLFFAIWVRWLEKIRTGERMALWAFPVLMLVWANTHGGFIFGFLAWAAYLAGWLWETWQKSSNPYLGRKLLLVGGASLIASVLTPDLWRNWQGVFANNSIYVLSHTSETMPPNFSLIGTLPFAALLLVTLIFVLLGWKQTPASHIFLLAGFTAMSLAMARNIPFFAVTDAPILAGYLGQTRGARSLWLNLEEGITKIEGGLRGHVWPILTLLCSVGFFAYYQVTRHVSVNQFSQQTLPVQATDWIASHPQTGNMFNDFNWGGYLLYRLWPAQRVFIDSQSDFYGEQLTRQYAEILGGTGDWDTELRQYGVTWIIVPPLSGLAEAARTSADWQIIYEDPVALISVRK